MGKFAVDVEGFEALALPLLRERGDARLVVIDEVRRGGDCCRPPPVDRTPPNPLLIALSWQSCRWGRWSCSLTASRSW